MPYARAVVERTMKVQEVLPFIFLKSGGLPQ